MIEELNLEKFIKKHGVAIDSLTDLEKGLIRKISLWDEVNVNYLLWNLEDYTEEEIKNAIATLKLKKLINLAEPNEFDLVGASLNKKEDDQ